MIVGARKERVKEKSRDRHDSSTSRVIVARCSVSRAIEKSFRRKEKKRGKVTWREGEKRSTGRESVASREKRKKRCFLCLLCGCVSCALACIDKKVDPVKTVEKR